VIALGNVAAAVFTNDQLLADMVLAAAKTAGERAWQMPMFEEYKEQNKSEVADVKNVGGRPAGAITAAQFLPNSPAMLPGAHGYCRRHQTDKERKYYVQGSHRHPGAHAVNLAISLAINRFTLPSP
jgi:hypothetical protein